MAANVVRVQVGAECTCMRCGREPAMGRGMVRKLQIGDTHYIDTETPCPCGSRRVRLRVLVSPA